ncbi:SusC/RagA family TonB-linked outer membrane protein [Parabacteroides pacaensis]|uniref:SusC/RagA family TonB-linked outer membrane protein n=1 Tax=Parabacteroides pacaensis TaxID=2086575 RepID=UPI000D0FFF2F|nr:SusC/RagA family TonB-linked outer membrane protein [Parabacteroides pacaensis]
MRIVFVLLCASLLQAVATEGYSQGTKVSIEAKQLSLDQLFSRIEKQSSYLFFYVDADIKDVFINVHVQKKEINELLTEILKNTSLTYKIDGNNIHIYKKATTLQQKTKKITGRITDSRGELLIGVNIVEAGTTNGVISDINGAYILHVAGPRSVLKFSYIGYKPVEITVGNGSIVDITMEEEQSRLDEVVVVGYGQQRKISTIGSQSTIEVKDIKQPTASLSTSLAGRLSGVVAVQRTGEPGKDGADIWIRGIATPGAAHPLILVDGVERAFNDIDPEDIESFTVLKDASATAVYGVRGANGVIIIKTKPGKIGKAAVSVDYYESFTRMTRKVDLADGLDYMKAANEAMRNSITGEYSPLYSEEYIKNTAAGTDPLLYPNVDWMKEIFNDWGHNRRVNVNLRGGNQTATYYASASYYNETGMTKTDALEDYNADMSYTRYNFTTNLNINVTRTTQVDIGMNGYLGEGNYPDISANDAYGSAMEISPVDYPKMFVIDGVEYVPGIQSNGGLRNPYADIAKRGYRNVVKNQVYSNLRLTQDLGIITKGLNITGMFAYDIYNTRETGQGKRESTYYFKDRNNPYDENGNPILVQTFAGSNTLGFGQTSSGNRKVYMEASLNYDRAFGKHRLGALLLYNQQSFSEHGHAKDNLIASLPYRTRGLAGRATYSWDDRYFGEFNIGYNGSENFAPDKRYGVFPAFGLGWVASNEKFWKALTPFISFLKIRYTNGTIGNGSTDRRFLYLGSMEYNRDHRYEFGSDRHNVDGVKVLNEAVNVGWEKSHKQDLGVDIKFLHDDLSFVIDFFKEHRTGIFLERKTISDMMGITTTSYGNLGIVNNKGVEVMGEYNKQFGKDWIVSLRGNFTWNNDVYIENDQPEPAYPWLDRRGHNILARWGLIADGLYTQEEIDQIAAWEALPAAEKEKSKRPFPTQYGQVQAGDIKYVDLNDDGQIDDYDQTKIGRGDVPCIVYGFGFNVQYKQFSIGALFQGTADADRMISGNSVNPFRAGGGGGNLFSNINDRWTEENPRQDVFYPRLAYGEDKDSNKNNFRPSTWWQKDVSFLRLKSLQVAYELPKSWVNKVRLKNASIYLMGSNLLTFSKFKLWDPELNTNQGNIYPNISSYSVGINFNF